MIISRTPYRVSFFGGGTDFPAWYRQHGGAVLVTSIDKYCYLSVRRLPPFFDYRYRIVYSQIESVARVEQIQHPAVRAVLQREGLDRDDDLADDLHHLPGLVIDHDGDLPARSGLGSSSAFTVGLIHALRALKGQMTSQRELAQAAIQIEQDMLQEAVGCQDQLATALGGLNLIHFQTDGRFDIQPVVISPARRQQLESRLMLFFTGITRFSSQIAARTLANLEQQQDSLQHMRALVDEALAVLCDEQASLDGFGELLDQSWQFKRSLSEWVSNPAIDQLYARARAAGAIGGKLLGAGGGGFMLLFVPPADQARVRQELAGLVHVPFGFETQGSRIVMYQPEGLGGLESP